MTEITAGANNVRLVGDTSPFEVSLTSTTITEDVEEILLHLRSQTPARPGQMELLFNMPCVDVYAPWAPLLNRHRSLPPDWTTPYSGSAARGAPVACLFSGTGDNRVTVALSDALRPARMRANIREENARLECGAVIFENSVDSYTEYSVTLRIDRRAVPYYQSLNDVRLWWERQPGYEPAPVPDSARLPVYSTWYSFHQDIRPDEIERECRLAKELGCESVIVDDGWMCEGNERGYAHCGDWEAYTQKFPDMAGHVRRVHEIGMKYILWYSVPFVGLETKAGKRFKGYTLLPNLEKPEWAVFDPRYPAVREYLIGIYETAVRDWDLDGFKLDFVDAFHAGADAPAFPEETDCNSVPEGVDKLMTAIIQRLSALKPDICIEFRQPYIGPLMRKYGNMFRSGDCPADLVQNRVNTVDIRLLIGDSATHTDMVMWSPEEPVESAALQLINGLFAVPQISVLIDQMPADHQEMIKFWLAFFREHRDLLLNAVIEPKNPEILYPQVGVRGEQRGIVACYGPNIVSGLKSMPAELILVNGTRTRGLLLADLPDGEYQVQIKDCKGISLATHKIDAADGAAISIDTPPAGIAILLREG